MASTDKKKVKITESSKQANVDITSKTITLPADSVDHTLVATVPSAANCTSGVNVEVEMSPDGTNWCPAVRKETVTTAGSTTAAIIGNEKYVDLKKKAPVYNSYAKGGLNFDTNGNTVSLGTGTRDLLDQHIAVNKSFNHSMWIKSNTLPHTAQDETVTFTVTVAGGKFYIDGVIQSSVYLREGSTYTFDQSDSSNSGHPLKLSTTDNGTHGGGVEYTSGVTIAGTPGTAGAFTQIHVPKNEVDLYYYCANHSLMGGNAYTPVPTDYKPVLFRHGGYDNFENTKVPELVKKDYGTAISHHYTMTNNAYYSSTDAPHSLDLRQGYTVSYASAGLGSYLGNHGTPIRYDFTDGSYFYAIFSNSGYGQVWFYYKNTSVSSTEQHKKINLPSRPSNYDKFGVYPAFINMAFDWVNDRIDLNAGNTYGSGAAHSYWNHSISPVTTTSGGFNANDLDFSSKTISSVRLFPTAHAPQATNLNRHIVFCLAASNRYITYTNAELAQYNHPNPVTNSYRIEAKNHDFALYFGGGPYDNVSTRVIKSIFNSNVTFTPTDSGTNLVKLFARNSQTYALYAPWGTTAANMAAAESEGNKITQNLTSGVSSYSTQFTSISQASSGDGAVYVDVGSDAATFYGSTGGTTVASVTNGNENDIGKHMLGIYKPDVAFSSSRWILANSSYKSAGFTHRSGDWFGYIKINYAYTGSGSYIRFGNYLNFSPFITYSPSASAAKKLRIKPVIAGSSTGYWLIYKNSDGKYPLTFTKASGGNLIVPNIEEGFHCVCTYDPPAYPNQGIPAANVKLYVNGQEVLFRTTTENGVDYVEDAAPADNLFAGDEVYGHDSSWGGTPYLDYGTQGSSHSNVNNHMDFSNRVLTASEVATLYNAGKVLDFSNMQSSFPISLTGCVGAYDADVPLYNHNSGYTSVRWGYKDCSGYGKHIIHYTGSNSTFSAAQTLRADYNPSWLAGPSPLSNTHFQSNTPVSISGWFKTTDTGMLFSNTEGADVSGLKAEITSSGVNISFKTSSATQNITTTPAVNDGNWHHILVVLEPGHSTKKQKIYIDGLEKVNSNHTLLTEAIQGNNGFTLLSDGQNTKLDSSPSSSDSSKLNGIISNWSIHSEALDSNAAKQLYSNGNIRNIKNLPSVNASQIKSWWQLNDATNPQNDLMGYNNLHYLDLSGSSDKALFLTPDSTNSSTDGVQITGTNKNPFGTTASDTQLNLGDGLGVTMQIKLETGVAAGQNFSRKVLFSVQCTNGKTIEVVLEKGTSSGDLYVVVFMSDTSSFSSANSSGLLKQFSNGVLDDGNWHTLSFNFTDDNANLLNSVSMFMDGSQVTMTSHPWVGFTNTSFVGTVDNVIIGSSTARSGGNTLGMDMTIDNLAFFTGYVDQADFDATAAGVLHTNRHDLLSATLDATNTPGQPIITSLFKMGDGSTDIVSPNSSIDIKEIKYGHRSITPQANFSSSSSIATLTIVDDPYQGSGGTVATLNSYLIDATGEALVQKTINGNAMTLSITKNFDFSTNAWISSMTGDTAFCLSLNGFEEQAEYFALWKCSQTLPDGGVDVCDGNWHNIALSYRGQNDLSGNNVAEGDPIRFGRGSANNPFNFSLAIDGYPVYTEIGNNTGADYIGGNNTLITDTISGTPYNVGFNIYNRHLKYISSNNEEEYKVHGQFGPAVHTYLPNENDPHSFRGEVDETSFHSDSWWVNSDGSNIGLFGSTSSKRGNLFNQEKTYTLYGRTGALDTRGSGKTPYAQGIPYPLLNPELLKSSGNISDIVDTNQFLNPVRKGDTQSWNSQVSTGGLEGWWRWGDTPGDCSITVNDVKDHNQTPPENFRDIDAVYLTDQGTSSNVVLASPTNESIYLQGQAASTTSGTAGTQYNQIKLENLSSLVSSAACTVKDFVSPVLQYLRIKLTGSGTCDIGEGKLEIEVNYKKRRMK